MRAWILLAALATTLLAATSSFAFDAVGVTPITAEDVASKSLSLTVGFQDVLALVPSSVPTFNGITSGSVYTIGGTYRHRLGVESNWFIDGGFHYGTGNAKLDDSGPIPFVQKESLSAVFGNAGMGYVLPITTKTSLYGSGRIFYTSATAKLDDGLGEIEGEPFTVWGFEPGMGCSHRINPKFGYYGEFYSQFGWGSGEVGNVTYNSTVKYNCWRGGISYIF